MIQVLRFFSPILKKTVYREGSIATILFGPARGLKYKIFPGYGRSMIYGGWEPELHKLMAEQIRPGDVVYDLGANFGIYSIYMARLVGPKGKVYSFEPIPAILEELKENVKRNQLTNVEFIESAVSNVSGTTSFRIGNHFGSGHLNVVDEYHRDSGDEVTVKTVSLDDMIGQGAAVPNFIKMDIEGAEGLALEGATKLLKNHRPKIAVEVHSDEQASIVGRILSECGYEGFNLDRGMAPIDGLANGFHVESGAATYVIALPK